MDPRTKKSFQKIYTAAVYSTEDDVFTSAPAVEGTIEFFPIGKYISAADLDLEYERRGLVPADPFALAKWCEKEQKENTYYTTQWKDENGKYCYAAFYRWSGDDRNAFVHRRSDDWNAPWVFAGVRKSSELGASGVLTSALSPFELPPELVINGVQYRKMV